MYGRTTEPYGATYTSCFYMGYMNNTWNQNCTHFTLLG